MRRYGALALVLLVALALTTAGLVGACGSSTSSDASQPPGSAADVVFIEPGAFDVAGYAGRPLIVNFFGSWCPPCNSEAPELAAFARENAGAVQFVGIAVNDTRDAAAGFMAEYGLDFPVVLDDKSLSARYGITGVPTTIFFAADGGEKDRIVGAAGAEQLEASLATIR